MNHPPLSTLLLSLAGALMLGSCSQLCPQDCSSCPPPTDPALSLEAWEASILSPTVEELRAGIKTHGEQGFGVCKGKTECESFLGATPGELAEGDYFLRTELKVPRAGTGWKADFHIECHTVGKETPPQVHDRSYDLRYMGADRGQRIQPLWRIQSPHPNGPRSCTYSLTPVRSDGVKATPIQGSYTTPAPAP